MHSTDGVYMAFFELLECFFVSFFLEIYGTARVSHFNLIYFMNWK